MIVYFSHWSTKSIDFPDYNKFSQLVTIKYLIHRDETEGACIKICDSSNGADDWLCNGKHNLLGRSFS